MNMKMFQPDTEIEIKSFLILIITFFEILAVEIRPNRLHTMQLIFEHNFQQYIITNFTSLCVFFIR